MAIFDQNIYQGVQDSLIQPESEFWKNWLEPAISGNNLITPRIDIIEQFYKKFPFFIKDDILSCDSDYDSFTLTTDNLPNKYIPGIRGIDLPRAEIYMRGSNVPMPTSEDFKKYEFEYISCRVLYVYGIDKISNINICTNHFCFFKNTKILTNVSFNGPVRFYDNPPEMYNCSSFQPIDLTILTTDKTSNQYINGIRHLIRTTSNTQYRRKRWIAPHPIEISDIVDVSNIRLNRVRLLFDNRISARAEFTECKGISKSNIRGWEAFYWTECL